MPTDPNDPIALSLQGILAELAAMNARLGEERAARLAAEAQQQQLVDRLASLEAERSAQAIGPGQTLATATAGPPPPITTPAPSALTADLLASLPSPSMAPFAPTATPAAPTVPLAQPSFVDPHTHVIYNQYPQPVDPHANVTYNHSNMQFTGFQAQSQSRGEVKGPKVAVPQMYDGTKGTKAESYVNQVGLYILANQSMFPNDKSKLTFALSYLTGAASQWAAPLFKELLHNLNATFDFNKFAEDFEATYFDSDKISKAEAAIRVLGQKGSVADYTSKFNALATIVGWEDSTLVSHYKQGLKSEIKVNMVLKVFKDVGEISKMAIAIDNELHSTRQSSTSTSTSTTLTRDPDAMDCSAIRYPISKEVYQKRLNDQACFKCGSMEHWASGCRNTGGKGKGRGKVAELEAKIVELTARVDGKGEGSNSRADESKNGGAQD